MALVILLLPATYNFVCFNFPMIHAGTNRAATFYVYPIACVLNGVGFALIVFAVWFQGLAALQLATWLLHKLFARCTPLAAWKQRLYLAVGRAPRFAVAGAVLWTIWVAAFYQFGVGFYAISVPIGIAAHVLAAGLYLPLVLGWYKLERAALRNAKPPS